MPPSAAAGIGPQTDQTSFLLMAEARGFTRCLMIQLKRLGHVLLKVADVERSKAFYADLLGFEVVEQDPAHGGVFMSLGEYGHTIDLSPVDDPATVQPLA